nr:hypothetical protein [Tanacetum cinerariifolium]
MLSIGGRLTLVKSVLGSMPIFHMSLFKVPAGILRTLESIRCHFFNGHDISSKKASWVQWNKAIHGRDGKIRIGSINGTKSCWLSIVNEINILAKKNINLMEFMHIKLGNGDSTAFWEDLWCDDRRLKDRYPRAYSLETCKSITVSSKLTHSSLAYSFRRDPRGGVEKSQLEELTVAIQDVSLTSSRDRWVWELNGTGDFSVSSIRNLIDSKLLPKGDFKTKWIRHVPIKVNTFA